MLYGVLTDQWGAFTINIGFWLLHANNARKAVRSCP